MVVVAPFATAREARSGALLKDELSEEHLPLDGGMLDAGAHLQESAMLSTYVPEDADRDPVGPSNPLDLFSRAAAEVGLIRPGDPLDQSAAIGDNYLQHESPQATVGDRIRADLHAP